MTQKGNVSREQWERLTEEYVFISSVLSVLSVALMSNPYFILKSLFPHALGLIYLSVKINLPAMQFGHCSVPWKHARINSLSRVQEKSLQITSPHTIHALEHFIHVFVDRLILLISLIYNLIFSLITKAHDPTTVHFALHR